MIHVKKNSLRADPELIKALSKHSSATVHEAMGKRGAVRETIKPIARGMKICGTALTVRTHAADNLMLIKAVNMAQAGDVIVVNLGRILDAGPFGEVLAVECQTKGVAGLVIDGSVRDTREMAEMEFPVFAAGASICGTAKATLGTINHPIVCGDEIVHPGDIVLGDDDGVVIIPISEAAEILRAADERVSKEEAVMRRLRAGESLWDIYGYQPIFESLGCIEE